MSPFMEKTLLLLGVLCCIQVISTALMCYDCNSEYDPRCGDPFEPYSIGEVNCSKQEPLEHLKDKYKPILCRKTVQKIYGKTRIVRGCGYIPDERTDKECIRRSGTHDVSATYCACTKELCNGATAVGANQMPLILALAAGFAIFVTRHSIRVESS
ncbi:GH21037 [Drosophila grimshawi]|uniref:GH21037 n=1 Tax=Drosophila grimshawi TaxID=7222 RepID=B4J586_DROGR|nr:GH21037 [Drosophila grimshawi]